MRWSKDTAWWNHDPDGQLRKIAPPIRSCPPWFLVTPPVGGARRSQQKLACTSARRHPMLVSLVPHAAEASARGFYCPHGWILCSIGSSEVADAPAAVVSTDGSSARMGAARSLMLRVPVLRGRAARKGVPLMLRLPAARTSRSHRSAPDAPAACGCTDETPNPGALLTLRLPARMGCPRQGYH